MQVHTNLNNFKVETPVLTIGVFDGVHLGHISILERLKEITKKYNGESVILTLWPHPRIVLNKDIESLRLLSNIEEKKQLLSKTGIDHLIILPFTKEFSKLTACEFIEEFLVKKINVKHLIIGYNHQFGKNREAGYDSLNNCASKYGFSIERLEAKSINDDNISSTKIRNFLNQGDINKANKYLGYEYFIKGNVVEGNRIGRKMGFPTANIKIPEAYKQIPANGVYAVKAILNNNLYYGMLNIGTRPTLQLELQTHNIEVHIFDFNKKIYNEEITIRFVTKIRDEKKFSNIEELSMQLEKDQQKIKELFSKK